MLSMFGATTVKNRPEVRGFFRRIYDETPTFMMPFVHGETISTAWEKEELIGVLINFATSQMYQGTFTKK